MKKFALVMSVLAVAWTASAENFFFTTKDKWLSFGDSANWAVGVHKAAGNPDNLVPTENDYFVYWSTNDALTDETIYGPLLWLDLSATEAHPSNIWSVKGFYQDFQNVAGTKTMNFWNPFFTAFRKGEIIFTETYTNNWSLIRVEDGGTFTVAATASSRLGNGAAINEFQIKNTGTVNLGGALHLKSPQIMVDDGGTLKIEPTVLKWDLNAADPEFSSGEKAKFITNSGTFTLPNGFKLEAPDTYTAGGNYDKYPPVLTITQAAGTLTIGDDITLADKAGTLKFVWAGGTVTLTHDVTFAGNCVLEMPDDATITFNIDTNTLDLSKATFGANTTVNITGTGKVILGAEAPTTLNLPGDGALEFSDSITISTDQIPGWSTTTLSVCPPKSRCDVVITTADSDLKERLVAVAPGTDREWEMTETGIVNHVSASKTFIWYKSDGTYRLFSNANYWLEGIRYGSATPAIAFPGDRDWIGFVAEADTYAYSHDQKYDLGGQHYRVKGISITGVESALGYGYRYRGFSNGTMEFTDLYYAHRDKVTIASNATFLIPESCKMQVEWGGAENDYYVSGNFHVYGPVEFCCLRVWSYAGGEVIFDPSSVMLTTGAGTTGSWFENQGTMKFPHGLALTGSTKRTTQNHTLEIRQCNGEMTIGGDFTADKYCSGDAYTFALKAGTLKVTDNSCFTLFDTYGMPDAETTATIDIAEGKMLKWQNATFAEGTTLNVTGTGALALASDYPTTLNFAEGAHFGIVGDIDLDAALAKITWAGDKLFMIGSAGDRDVTVTTTDAALRTQLMDETLTPAPAGWTRQVAGDTVVFAAASAIWRWRTKLTVGSFGDPNLWSLGISDTFANPSNEIPGLADYIWIGSGGGYEKQLFDLDGKHYKVAGLSNEGYTGYLWYEKYFSVENGTLEILQNMSNYFYQCEIKDTGKFILAASSVSKLGQSGANNRYTIRSGGEVDFYGAIEIENLRFTIDTGGKLVLDPVEFRIGDSVTESGGYCGQSLDNSGLVECPNGFTFSGATNPAWYTKDNPLKYTIQNLAGGTIKTGGDIRYATGTQGFLYFLVKGGTLEATEDAKVTGMTEFTISGEPTLKAASGKTLDVSEAAYAADASVTVEGAVKFGATLPATVTLAAGSKMVFTALNTTLGTINGVADADFEFAGTPAMNEKVLISDDATLLSAIGAKMILPEGWAVVQEGNALVFAAYVPDPKDVTCFQSEGEKSLADDQGSWNTEGGVVPAGGDVFVSGANTIAVLDADTVAYDSISVMRGATLKVTGTIENLPAITLYYGSRLLFAEDAALTLTEPITAYARAAELPIVEVASGAVVQVADGYSSFKNQHLKNAGTLKFLGAAYIGTAEVGETTLFQLTAEGGKFDFTVSNKDVRWVGPKAEGGRVQVVGKILLKNARSYASNNNMFRCSVGRDNPVDEVIDFELDNTTLMLETNSSADQLGGGVHFSCFNGGKIEKAASSNSPGIYGRINFVDAVQATFDGADSRFLYFYNRYKVTFKCDDDDHEVLTFKNGAYFHVMNFEGNQKNVVGFEDGFWDITEKPAYDAAYWKGEGRSVEESETQNYLIAPFTGFKAIRIASGKTLGLRSFSVNPYDKKGEEIKQDRRWNRVMTLANVPVTGENGSMFVTNAAPEQSLQVTLTCGSNTATGDLWAEPSADGCELLLANGANWAGTLVANACVGFTNLTDAAAAATVTVGNVRMNGRFPIRVWKGATAAENTADQLTILGTLLSTKGGFAPVEMNGAAFALGDTFTIGTIPAANLPADYERGYTTALWRLVTEGEGDTKTLKLVFDPMGAIFLVK